MGLLEPAGQLQEATACAGTRHAAAWINLLGVRVSAVNLTQASDLIRAAIAAGRREFVCIRDAHGLVRSQRDADLRALHNRAFLVTPDGMPLVWALRRAGHGDAGRVYGPDLMLDIADRGRAAGLRHFFYGATPDVLDALRRRLTERFPGMIVAGTRSPPFRPLSTPEQAAEVAAINASGADIVWVGLGSPKQEHWMARMRGTLAPPMLIGVGAAFDFHAGRVRQAPKAIQRSGLEWAFRLFCEPRRLWRRYAVTVPSFLVLSIAQRLALRRFPLDEEPQATSIATAPAERGPDRTGFRAVAAQRGRS